MNNPNPPKVDIMFVCEANLGRSPAFETATQIAIRQTGLDGKLSVASTGILAEDIAKRRQNFENNYQLSPERYISAHGTLPHLVQGKADPANDDYIPLGLETYIDCATWASSKKMSRVGAPPAYLGGFAKQGIDPRLHADKHSKPLDAQTVANAGVVLTMDENIKNKVVETVPESKGKVYTVTEYLGRNGAVDDAFHPINGKSYVTLDGKEIPVLGPDGKGDIGKQVEAVHSSIPDIFKLSTEVVDKYVRAIGNDGKPAETHLPPTAQANYQQHAYQPPAPKSDGPMDGNMGLAVGLTAIIGLVLGLPFFF